jgi:RNA polymerase sigma-70 factor (ECF subfamily)
MMAMSAAKQHVEQLPFAEVITRHQRMIYGYLLRFTRNVHDAQDLFQETFLRAYRAYAVLPTDADLRAWLMRIAVNLSKNYVRDRQRRNRVLVDEEQGQDHIPTYFAENSNTTEQMMISQETAQTLLATIDALPFRQRTALIQRQFEGLEYDAIAANLECSPESARAHVYQALRKLRFALSADQQQSE